MRRNTVRLLKYLVVAAGLVLFGPMALRYLLSAHRTAGGGLDEQHGMPEAPDVVKRHQTRRTVRAKFSTTLCD